MVDPHSPFSFFLFPERKAVVQPEFQSGRATAALRFYSPRFYGFAIFAVPGWVCDFAS